MAEDKTEEPKNEKLLKIGELAKTTSFSDSSFRSGFYQISRFMPI